MYSNIILIIDKRTVQGTKYRKILMKEPHVEVFCKESIENSVKILQDLEPDLILISDSIEDTLLENVNKVRTLSMNSNPIIIALSKSNHLQDKLKIINSGADDFFSEPIDILEFQARINAYLRRNCDNNINEKTKLYNDKISNKVLRRVLNQQHNTTPWAVFYLNINNLKFYKEIYGDLAGEKMVQTYIAIMLSSLSTDDYLGHIFNDDFLIVTNNFKAQKIAQYLIWAFDSIAQKFYSEQDANQGFMILNGDIKAEERINLVTTSIGVISNEYKHYFTLNQILAELININKMARLKVKSSFLIEHAQISTTTDILEKRYNNKVLIVELDDDLALLLKTVFKLKNFDVRTFKPGNINLSEIEDFLPSVMVVDAGRPDELLGLDFCKILKSNKILKDSKIILTTVIHDKQKILSCGADFYLPKPYELTDISILVHKYMKEFNF